MIGFIDAPYSSNEADGQVSFQVGVTNGVLLGQEVSVDFSTVDLSSLSSSSMAIAGLDYTAISGQTLTFGTGGPSVPGNTRTTVSVSVSDDDVFELNESFGGTLSFGGSLERFTLGPDTATATIVDEDGEC